jgi:hypothetical protein
MPENQAKGLFTNAREPRKKTLHKCPKTNQKESSQMAENQAKGIFTNARKPSKRTLQNA